MVKKKFNPTFPFSDISRQYHRCTLVNIIGWEKQDRDKGGEKEERKGRTEGRERKNNNFSNTKYNPSLTVGCRELFSHFVPCSTTFSLQSMRTLHLGEFWEAHQKLKNNSAIFNIKRFRTANKTPSEWLNL